MLTTQQTTIVRVSYLFTVQMLIAGMMQDMHNLYGSQFKLNK